MSGRLALVGVAMGFVLGRAGFSSWDEVHAMFRFRDARLFLVFGAAVVALAASWALVRRFSAPRWAERPLRRGTILGGLLFGVGWAVSGACPAIAFVQLGEGQLAALATILGVFAGNWLFGAVQRRWLRWETTSCLDE